MISKTKKNIKTIFLTGATGLVGSYLLKTFLKNNYKVYALARSKDNRNARERVFEVLKFWDKNVLLKKSNNLIVLEGDITRKNLGLDKPNVDLLKREVEEIFHCAAETKFNAPLKEIRKINVEGTMNVLELAVKCSKNGILKKVNHISTAYVCGDYKGVFKEDKLGSINRATTKI
ncbi:MAG: SDR family oxidoreductase [Candidatus Firestonebacteria bacterium]|nr:SDR family oxidoreductase [Candidatus Firestonebacteria bacterium]